LRVWLKKYGKSEGQIALNWAISQGVTVIPKSNSVKRIVENYDSCRFRLDKEDLAKFDSLEDGTRFCNDRLTNFGGFDAFSA